MNSLVLNADITPSLLPNVVCTETHTNRLVRILRASPHGFYECVDVFSNKILNIHRLLLMPMPTIPSRFKQHQFMQVAQHLATALNSWPIAIRVDPTPFAVETLARKLREAIEAKKIYHWRYAGLNEKLWEEHGEELVVSIDVNNQISTILVGSRDAIRNKKVKSGAVGQDISVRSDFELLAPSPEELEQICLLLHMKKLKPIPVVFVRGLTSAIVESLELRYDIALLPLESDPNSFQILSA